MASFTGNSSSERITPTFVSGSVVRNPAGSLPGVSADIIRGNGGDDTIDGGGGNNSLYGGTGYDEIHGGAGND